MALLLSNLAIMTHWLDMTIHVELSHDRLAKHDTAPVELSHDRLARHDTAPVELSHDRLAGHDSTC